MKTLSRIARIHIPAALLFVSASPLLTAARLSYHVQAPAPGVNDVSNLIGASRDRDNIGGDGYTDGDINDHSTYIAGVDRPHQGQTFTTGSNPAGYQVNAVWLRHAGYSSNTAATWWCAPADSALTVRVTRPSAVGTFAFAMTAESVVATGREQGAPNALSPVSARVNSPDGTGLWLRFALSAPVALYPNKKYGFDLTARTPEFFLETLGLRDDGPAGDPYPGGEAYTGASIGAPDSTLRPLAGDRVFLVEMSPAIEAVRDGAEVFLYWAPVGGAVSRIDVLRGDRASVESRTPVASFSTPTQSFLDKLPSANAVVWYWLVFTRPDGSTESMGPVAARSSGVWTP